MNADDQFILFMAALVVIVIVVSVCMLLYTIASARIESQERIKALELGYEQKFVMEQRQSNDWAWVKKT